MISVHQQCFTTALVLLTSALQAAPPIAYNQWTVHNGKIDSSAYCDQPDITCTVSAEDNGFLQLIVNSPQGSHIQVIMTEENASGTPDSLTFTNENFIPQENLTGYDITHHQVIRDPASNFTQISEIAREPFINNDGVLVDLIKTDFYQAVSDNDISTTFNYSKHEAMKITDMDNFDNKKDKDKKETNEDFFIDDKYQKKNNFGKSKYKVKKKIDVAYTGNSTYQSNKKIIEYDNNDSDQTVKKKAREVYFGNHLAMTQTTLDRGTPIQHTELRQSQGFQLNNIDNELVLDPFSPSGHIVLNDVANDLSANTISWNDGDAIQLFWVAQQPASGDSLSAYAFEQITNLSQNTKAQRSSSAPANIIDPFAYDEASFGPAPATAP